MNRWMDGRMDAYTIALLAGWLLHDGLIDEHGRLGELRAVYSRWP
jgi:hypothetical protein